MPITWEDNSLLLKGSQSNHYVLQYLVKCYEYLSVSESKVRALEADGSFKAAELASYKANQVTKAGECMTKALKLILSTN